MEFFKKRIIPDDNREIQSFIADINNKTHPEMIFFLKQYRNKLKEPDLKRIIESSHGNGGTIYHFILNYQIVSSDLLVFIIEKNRFDIIGEDLFINFLKKFKNGIKYENFVYLTMYFEKNKRILIILNLYNPKFSKKKSLTVSLANSIQTFNISLKMGKLSDGIKIGSVLLMTIVAIFGYRQISHPYLTMEPYVSFPLFFYINYLFAILLSAMIFSLVIGFFLDLIIRFIWYILGFFSSDEKQII